MRVAGSASPRPARPRRPGRGSGGGTGGGAVAREGGEVVAGDLDEAAAHVPDFLERAEVVDHRALGLLGEGFPSRLASELV